MAKVDSKIPKSSWEHTIAYVGIKPFRELTLGDLIRLAKVNRKIAEKISDFLGYDLDFSRYDYLPEPNLAEVMERHHIPEPKMKIKEKRKQNLRRYYEKNKHEYERRNRERKERLKKSKKNDFGFTE
jgi:hypothetical protein